MRQREDQVKRQQDEVLKIKNDFNALSKKEGGNLQTKDFTEDIYERGVNGQLFVSGSEMFCNLIAVVPNAKIPEFRERYCNLMNEYYQQQDTIEMNKVVSDAEKKLKLMKDAGGEAWTELVTRLHGAVPAEWNDATHNAKLVAHFKKELEDAIKKRQKDRFAFPLVPDAFTLLPPLDDKDKENTCVRLIAYTPQVDDVQKYLRKMGYSSRVFTYNFQKYQEDKKQR